MDRPDEQLNLTPQKRFEQESRGVMHEARVFRYKMEQPPKGLPQTNSEISIPLTLTDKNIRTDIVDLMKLITEKPMLLYKAKIKRINEVCKSVYTIIPTPAVKRASSKLSHD